MLSYIIQIFIYSLSSLTKMLDSLIQTRACQHKKLFVHLYLFLVAMLRRILILSHYFLQYIFQYFILTFISIQREFMYILTCFLQIQDHEIHLKKYEHAFLQTR